MIGTILIPPWIASTLDLFQKPGDVLLRQHLATAVRSAGRHSAQAAFTLACLPYEAFFSLDAILRTVWRLVIRRRLLEWNPSSDSDRISRDGPRCLLPDDVDRPDHCLCRAGLSGAFRPAALCVAAPILVLWFASPAIAWWISRPLARRGARLTADQTALSPDALPKDVVVLRDVRRSGRSLAAA